jgi:hypothetical protein
MIPLLVGIAFLRLSMAELIRVALNDNAAQPLGDFMMLRCPRFHPVIPATAVGKVLGIKTQPKCYQTTGTSMKS